MNTNDVDNTVEKILFQEEVGEVSSNVVDLSEEFKNIKDGNITEKDIENYINELIGKPLDTSTPPLQIQITSDNKAHIIRPNVELKGNQIPRHKSALNKVENIINQAIKSGEKDVDLTHNTSEKTLKHKSNIEKYIYFESPITINNKNYTVKFSTEQVKGQDNNLLDLYNVQVKSSPDRVKDTLSRADNFNIQPKETEVNTIDLKIGDSIKNKMKELSKAQDNNLGENLLEGKIDDFAIKKAEEIQREYIDEMSFYEFMESYYDNKDLGEINEEIEDEGDFEGRETPFESEEEALLYLKDVFFKSSQFDNIVQEYVDNMDSGDWDNLREEFSNTNDRIDFFDDYQNLIKDIMEQNGLYVKLKESRISDSRYLEVFRTEEDLEDGSEPLSQIRISDHDTHNYYGDHINLYTTEPIENEIKKLVKAFKQGDFGIEETIYNYSDLSDVILNQNANGFFDSELKAIVLGSNFNFGTLPHEMAHFFLDKNFKIWKRGDSIINFVGNVGFYFENSQLFFE